MGDRLYDKRMDCFFRLENEIIDYKLLKGLEYSVYVVLCRYANNSDGAFPSYETIANQAGVSKRQVIRIIKTLIEKQLLEKITRKKKGKKVNDTNVYYILSAKSLGGDCESLRGDCESLGGGDCESPIKRTNSFIKKKGKTIPQNNKPSHRNFDEREYKKDDLDQYYTNVID